MRGIGIATLVTLGAVCLLVLPQGIVQGGAPKSTVATPTSATAAPLTWNLGGGPSFPRPGPGVMTYDANDQELLELGMTGTWTLQGTNWTQLRTASAPAASYVEAMTYDAADHYVLLFGGAHGNQTWKYSHGNWTRLHPSVHPGPAGSVSMTYDARDGYVVMYHTTLNDSPSGNSGYFTANISETWSFVGGTWSLLVSSNSSVTQPTTRFGVSLAYDDRDHYVVLFGGCPGWAWRPYPCNGWDGGRFVVYSSANDTWKFVNGTWTQLTPSIRPPGRVFGAMAFDFGSHSLVLFGGSSPSNLVPGPVYLNDTWRFSGGNWSQVNSTVSPLPRSYDAPLAFDATTHRLVLYGGSWEWTQFTGWGAPNRLSDTWTLKGGHWTEVSPSFIPPEMAAATIAYDAREGYTLVYVPGQVANGYWWIPIASDVIGETWKYMGGNWTLLHLASSPPYRTCASMAYDPALGKVLLFGGESSLGGCMVPPLYGATAYFNETWTFSGGAWSNVTGGAAPPARGAASLAYDAKDGYMLLFGGWGGGTSKNLNDTWIYRVGGWTLLAPSHAPSSRWGAGLSFDPTTANTLLRGGESSSLYCHRVAFRWVCTWNQTLLADSWTFLNGTWTSLGSQPLVPRGPVSLGYDPPLRAMVLFGGYKSPYGLSNQTWEYAAGAWAQVSTSGAPPSEAGGTFTFDARDHCLLLTGGSPQGVWKLT
jgi:hypothetical protein